MSSTRPGSNRPGLTSSLAVAGSCRANSRGRPAQVFFNASGGACRSPVTTARVRGAQYFGPGARSETSSTLTASIPARHPRMATASSATPARSKSGYLDAMVKARRRVALQPMAHGSRRVQHVGRRYRSCRKTRSGRPSRSVARCLDTALRWWSVWRTPKRLSTRGTSERGTSNAIHSP